MKSTVLNLIKVSVFVMGAIFLSSCEKDDTLMSEEQTRLYNEPDHHTVGNGMSTHQLGEHVQALKFQYGSKLHHQAEFYTVPSEISGPRPLVILGPGGGFSSYSEMPKLRQLATNLALRGLNVAIVKYAIEGQTYNAFVKAFQDVRSSVRYFRLNADVYGVDTANIFVGGWSSGAALAWSVAYLDSNEIANISVTTHRNLFTNSVSQLGFDNSDNQGASSDVRGYIGMFTYSFDNNMIDRSDAAMMLINHWDAHFTNGTRIIGNYNYGGVAGFGTDIMAQAARQKGFVDGQDLEYIRINGNSQYKGANQASLHHEYWDDIAAFVNRNLIR